jgi:hypothetical protein
LAGQFDEALVQRRTRQADLPTQLVHGPWIGRTLVHQSDGLSDMAVAQRAQPAGRPARQ